LIIAILYFLALSPTLLKNVERGRNQRLKNLNAVADTAKKITNSVKVCLALSATALRKGLVPRRLFIPALQ
jgi:hypothetical protein